MSRNYRKEYDNYHSRPEQKIRRAARNAARARFKDADPNKDVHHKDNNPLNNDKNNLSLVTQHYNRREPRLRTQEDMGTVTGPHIAGTGDDSSTVKIRKKKKVRRRKTEVQKHRMSPDMSDWEKRNQLSRQIRIKFWKSLKGKKKSKELKFKLKNSKSLKKRVIDNVLAIQQKI
jgi:hypothetical protein